MNDTKKSMGPQSGITKAVRIAGGQVALAGRLCEVSIEGKKITQQAISLWVRQGHVPANRAMLVSEAVDWRVQPAELLAPELKAILLSMVSPAIVAQQGQATSIR